MSLLEPTVVWRFYLKIFELELITVETLIFAKGE